MSSTTTQVLNALVDLRAIARGNGMKVHIVAERPERMSPPQARISIMSTAGGMTMHLRRGEDAVDVIHAMVRNLQNANITSRSYER